MYVAFKYFHVASVLCCMADGERTGLAARRGPVDGSRAIINQLKNLTQGQEIDGDRGQTIW